LVLVPHDHLHINQKRTAPKRRRASPVRQNYPLTSRSLGRQIDQICSVVDLHERYPAIAQIGGYRVSSVAQRKLQRVTRVTVAPPAASPTPRELMARVFYADWCAQIAGSRRLVSSPGWSRSTVLLPSAPALARTAAPGISAPLRLG